ncbi:GDSL-type esterase/lipase family protein [uncultured Ruminococcus sp.]|uniref:GDSL-type esterase/lipase family protein n=1 Tax=uncultured Ruminococcus sp. TaxID=165186 RepID=UPI0025D6195E|nr:GDSL-type esterase/lipase family protein [uncultured Ruminococcus sp.]
MKSDNSRKSSKKWVIISVILLILCLLLSATLASLYIKQATPQRLLKKLGFDVPKETDWTLESWNSSIRQLNYDSDIVFIGDSLTRGENFQEYYPEKKIVNLGLTGDSLAGISERAALISELSPEMIFVEGGVNSLSSNSVDDLAELYETMIVDIIADNPGDTVFIQSVLPISKSKHEGGLTNENIVELNNRLQEIAERNGVTYIDVYSLYVLNGEMNPEYTKDGIHLKDEYKHLWLEKLSDYIDK